MCSDSSVKNLAVKKLVMPGTVFKQDENLSSNVPYYKRPDPFSRVMDQIRQSMVEEETESLQAKELFAELQKKAEKLIPNMNNFTFPSLDFIRFAIDGPSTSTTEQPLKFLPTKSLKDTVCEICGLAFASVQSKVRHVGRLHPGQKDKVKTVYAKSLLPYECSVCKKSFATASSLSLHRRRHDENQNRFSCSYCEKSYILPSELKKHLKRVHGQSCTSTSESRSSSRSALDDLECDSMPDI